MHLAYLDTMSQLARAPSTRRAFLKASATAAIGGSALAASPSIRGFRGEGPMNFSTGEDWIDTFFSGGAEAIIHYYADEFVFEDVTLFQTISDKESLYRAFLPFNDAGPDAPAGVHQFDVIRYDGGAAGALRGKRRAERPGNYTAELWNSWSSATLLGSELDYDEWSVLNWVWKAEHNMDFLGLPAKVLSRDSASSVRPGDSSYSSFRAEL